MRRPSLPSVGDFLQAVAFLTIIPVRARSSGGLGRAAAWFPLVGLLLGAILAAAQAGLVRIFPPLLSASLLVALWAILTGGLHLDGLIDSCDALPASVPRERRLEILRDPHRGAFGVAGLALFIVLKTAALAGLRPPAAVALLLAPTLARWAVLYLCGRTCARFPTSLLVSFTQSIRAILCTARRSRSTRKVRAITSKDSICRRPRRRQRSTSTRYGWTFSTTTTWMV